MTDREEKLLERFAGKVKDLLFPEFKEIQTKMGNIEQRMESVEKQMHHIARRLDDHQQSLSTT